jgi:hypothetical protein
VPGFSCEGALEYIDPREFTGGEGPCRGDSGAGAILPADHGTIFGVLSRGNFATGTCSEGIYERTDVWRWLMAKTVLANATATAPRWAKEAFPEHPAVGELCLGEGMCGADAECVSFDGRRSFTCAARCTGGCAAGFHCESDVCAPGAPFTADDSGCAMGARPSSDASLVLVVLGLGIVAIERAAFRTRRRRRRD